MILEYKGINIFYSDQGKGSAIILLHGFLENSSMWNVFLPELIKKNRVICIDLLGHGKTNCLGYVHTMQQMADAVKYVLKHLKLRKYHIVGHSMGGYVALAFAKKKPKALKGLCLMNSTYEADDIERKKLRERANKMVQTNFDNMVRMSFANLFSESSKTKHVTALDTALKEALNTPVQGYIAANEGMRLRENTFKLYKSLSCKKLIIIGEKDTVINGKELVDKTKNTSIKTVILTEGHMSHIENKEACLNNIMHFIE